MATMMSVPRRSAFFCGPIETPPKMAVTRRFARHTVGRERLVNLQRQLARRHEHQAARLARPGRTAAADEQAIDHRQPERGGLAGAGLRARQQVVPQNDRNRFQLHRRGRGVAQLASGTGKTVWVELHETS